MTALHACITASIVITTGQTLPRDYHPPPPLPAYATEQWIHYAASILAGETVPNCDLCDQWIACTIRRDVERGYSPWALHPGRWHGYRTPSPPHLAAVKAALQEQGCLSAPTCAFLGNLTDYRYWASGLAQGVPSHVVGNARGAIVCVPPNPATPSPAPSNETTASTTPHRPASPAPVRLRQPGHADE